MNPKDILEKLAAKENDFFAGKTSFVAPVLRRNGQVATRIEGIEYKFDVTLGHKRNPGWHVLHAVSVTRAKIEREATGDEILAYQNIFPLRRLIVVQQADDHMVGLLCDQDVADATIAPVYFSTGLEVFDYVDAIGDGSSFWYVSTWSRRDPALLDFLRSSLRNNTRTPNKIGLTPDEKKAYALAFATQQEALKTQVQRRLETALQHGNASLLSYREHGDSINVEWQFDGRTINSTVRRDSLQIISAGICLNNTDSRYDLASLPSVFREKVRRHGGLQNV